jgi:hypothetical protein
VLLTNQAVILYLWESLAQGKKCGELQIRQVEFGKQIAYPGWSKAVQKEQVLESLLLHLNQRDG